MQHAPCGCDVIEKAASHPDDRIRRALTKDGERARAGWRCPSATLPLAPALGEKQIAAVEACERLVGGVLPRQCPGLCVRTQDAHDVYHAHAWQKTGQLREFVPNPPKVLIDAINAYSQGIALRDAEQAQRLAEETRKLAERSAK